MPNHWESSARPLFVRTVFVNGHRHAILFEEDPVLHSTLKKISRANSSLSFASDHSLTSSESQDSNSDDRVSNPRNGEDHQRKDLSSELQGCLIKLRLASAKLENGTKSDEEKCSCNSEKFEKGQKENSKQKKHKWKRDKNCRRKRCESKENKVIGKFVNRTSSCCLYNYESDQRKKNYCVVKISSQPPKFPLSCQCDNVTSNCKCFQSGKMVISATVHNLFMSARKEGLLDSKVNKFLCENYDPIDLYWNNYLAKSYYNSLSERVFQWLDLARKRKNQKEKENVIQEDDFSNCSERIFSGKTFLGESKKTEYSGKLINGQRNSLLMKSENEQQEPFKEEIESQVPEFTNIKSISSSEKLQNDFHECFERKTKTPLFKSSAESQEESAVSEETNSPSECTLKKRTTPIKAPLKIQDLLLDYNLRGNFNISFEERHQKKIKETREPLTLRSRCRQDKEPYSTEEEEEEEKVITTPLNYWERKTIQKNLQFDLSGEQTLCHCNRNSDGWADKINNELLTEGFREKSQKSINDLNITRTQPDLIQNLLPRQHHDGITSLKTEKVIWGSERNTKRPQLHIFMPSLLSKDTSDDSMSECENVVNLF